MTFFRTKFIDEFTYQYLFRCQQPIITTVPVTVCDVAVISCLLHERWCEEGVLWGINYLFKKLQLEAMFENEPRCYSINELSNVIFNLCFESKCFSGVFMI